MRPLSLLLIPILRVFTSLKWSDFLRVVDMVALAAEHWQKAEGMSPAEKEEINQRRAGQVRDFITTHFPGVTGSRINLALELALAWLKRTAK